MPRNDDFDDDDRPRRRPRRDDEDDDRPARSRRRRDEDDDARGPRRKKKSNSGLIIGILVGVFVVCCGGGGTAAFFIYRGAKKGVEEFKETVQGVEDSAASQNNLKKIGLAAHNHHDILGGMPNNSYDVQGRPLLSWRVHLLPYLNEDFLYKQFNLNEPWDSPTNKPLLSRMPAVYTTPEARKKAGDTKTFYRGFTHAGAMFEKPQAPGRPGQMINFANVQDGLSNTILVFESGEAVEWTRPDEVDWSPGRPRPALGYSGPSWLYFNVVMADGMPRQIRKDIAEATLRQLIKRNDGGAPPIGWDR